MADGWDDVTYLRKKTPRSGVLKTQKASKYADVKFEFVKDVAFTAPLITYKMCLFETGSDYVRKHTPDMILVRIVTRCHCHFLRDPLYNKYYFSEQQASVVKFTLLIVQTQH